MIGKKYRHYKGNEYVVLAIAKHSETLEKMVVYQALYGEKEIWVRPYDMFVEMIFIGGIQMPRFALIEEKTE